MSINSHGFIAETSQAAADEAYPAYAAMMDRIGRERGWPPMSREGFDATRTLRGANLVGSPQEVIEKILFQHEIFGHDRFLCR
jgi:alkanesulfonate monooxygenase SsuD/methylene tetrahydromethanopterin reductase-like flavin-dependent oxidoreductase (luciferase family)